MSNRNPNAPIVMALVAIAMGLLVAAQAAKESIADTQDEQAISSRDWAANKMCEGRAFEWQGDVLICYKEVK